MLRILLSATLAMGLAYVQPLAAQPLTLSAAFEQALQNRAEYKAQLANVTLAARQNEKIRAQWRPQLSASADLRWNTQLQTSVLPIGEFGLPNTPADAKQEIQLGLPYNYSLGIQAEQKVYDPLRRIDERINDGKADAEAITLEKVARDIRYEVAEAYYAALYSREQLALASARVQQAELNVAVVEVQRRNGAALTQEADRFALDLANARFALRKAEQDLRFALEQLQYRMGAPLTGDLQLAETLAQLAADTLAPAAARGAVRPELRLEDANLTLNALNEERWQLRNRPTVSAYANYTLLHLNDGPNPFEAGTWFPFNYIGIRATAPLYDGRQAKLEAQDYSLRRQVNILNRQRIQANIDYEVQRQQKTLAQARIDWQQSSENTALARRLLAADRVRYEQGAMRQNELKNTELAVKEAEDNQLTATYNLLLAHLNLQKALGL